MTWKCPNCWTKYEIASKYADVLKSKKDCKFCVRKNPLIPTTAEMDKLFTQEDMRNRHTAILQCRKCRNWTIQIDYLINRTFIPCSGCGETGYDDESIKSLRTYNPDVDNKRKIKI